MILIKDRYFKKEDISYIGALEYTVSHGVRNNEIAYYFMVVVGGQSIKVPCKTKEEVAEIRNTLLKETT